MRSRNKTLVLAFKTIGSFELELIQKLSSFNFNVILPWFGNFDNFGFLFPEFVKPVQCNFFELNSAQAFQKFLFESYYPIDMVITNFNDDFPEDELMNFSTEEFNSNVEYGIVSYFNLLKSVFPLFDKESGFLFNLNFTEEVQLAKENGLKRVINAARQSLLQTVYKENQSTKIKVVNLEINNLFIKTSSPTTGMISLSNSGQLLDYILHLYSETDNIGFNHQVYLTSREE